MKPRVPVRLAADICHDSGEETTGECVCGSDAQVMSKTRRHVSDKDCGASDACSSGLARRRQQCAGPERRP